MRRKDRGEGRREGGVWREERDGNGIVGGWVGSLIFFFKQKTAYEMCGRDWSSDVCSSDLTVYVRLYWWFNAHVYLCTCVSMYMCFYVRVAICEIGRASCRERV